MIIDYEVGYLDRLKDLDSLCYTWGSKEWDAWIKNKDIKIRMLIDPYSKNLIGFYVTELNRRFNYSEVLRFCVHPDFRRIGHGRLLHLDLLRVTKGVDLITFIYEYTDLFILHWLIHWGWSSIGVLKNQFPDGAAYIFERKKVV